MRQDTQTYIQTHLLLSSADGIPQVITAGDSEESISATSATADSASLEGGGVGGVASSSVDPSFPPYSEDPLQPPSWETHANSDRDTLEDVSSVQCVSSAVILCSLQNTGPRGSPHQTTASLVHQTIHYAIRSPQIKPLLYHTFSSMFQVGL